MSSSSVRLEFGQRHIHLIGTAHVSPESVQEVEQAIETERPDCVCVELDNARYRLMQGERDWSKLNIFSILRQRKGFLLLANLALAAYQRRIAQDMKIEAGAEMRAALKSAQRLAIPYALCDRDIQITLRRSWRASSLWGKSKLLAALFGSVFVRQRLSSEEIENMRQHNVVEGMMSELASYLPGAKHALIDERDHYIAQRIMQQPGTRLLAVVGAGHVAGIARRLQRLHDGEQGATLEELKQVPPKSRIARFAPWIIPAVVVGLIALGFVRSGWDGGLDTLLRWVIVNGTLSAIGALAALANPITIAVSFLAAPLTSINPTIGVGFVTGILEAILRKPRVQDLESLHKDTLSLRGFYRNRLTHILLVFLFSSLGSAVGTFVALPFLFPGN